MRQAAPTRAEAVVVEVKDEGDAGEAVQLQQVLQAVRGGHVVILHCVRGGEGEFSSAATAACEPLIGAPACDWCIIPPLLH